MISLDCASQQPAAHRIGFTQGRQIPLEFGSAGGQN